MQAILALRYFYEEMKAQHVIAAGSLLDFILQSGEISIPVGRIHYTYMKPMSFCEYLIATKKIALLEWTKSIKLGDKHDSLLDKKANEELRKYFYLGGLPEVIDKYIESDDLTVGLNIQESILASYRDDFGKYASRAKHKYLEEVLSGIPKQICEKFKYSKVNPHVQSRDIKDALDLLISAELAHKVKQANATGLPLEAGASDKHFKVIFLDIELVQNMLGISKEIILANDFHSIASGPLAEQFVGQELCAYEDHFKSAKLYYWAREDKSNAAEIDYLIAVGAKQIPVEVKSSHRGKLKNLKYFMEHFDCPLGLRVSTNPLDYQDRILSIPLYAVSEIPRLIKSVL
jgi:predicted AAA+ superfamily ATPase